MATQTIPQGFKLVPDDQQLEAPEGRGRAEAMRTFLARGGGLTRLGRYRHGPMKGKTVQQATSMFEDSWSKASGDVKDKYATRSRDILTPSEKKAAGIGTPVPPPTAKDMHANQKAARMQYYQRIQGSTPVINKEGNGAPIQQSPTVKPMPAPSTLAGTPEEQARARQIAAEGGGFATAGNNDTAMGAAVAMSRQSQNAVPTTYPGEAAAEAGRRNNRPASEVLMGMANAETVKVSAQRQDANRVAAEQSRFKANSDARVSQGLPPLDQRSTDDRMRAEGKINARTTPITAPPVPTVLQTVGAGSPTTQPSNPPLTVATRPEAPTGAPIMGDAPKGVNRLTGLPFGFAPGDKLPDARANDAQMQQRANESVARQFSADPRNAGPVKTSPASPPIKPNATVSTPAPRGPSARPDGYVAPSMADDFARERRDAEYRAKSAAAGSQAVAAMGPAANKFFTGKVKPLNQLVKR